MNLEQHFLNNIGREYISTILNKYSFKNKNILELGAGEGDLSIEILKMNINSLVAVEIDTELINKAYKEDKYTLLNLDLKNINYSLYKEYICISAPPYSLIEFLTKEYINKYNIKYIILISEKYFKYFNDFKIIGELKEDMFSTISKKKHYLITNI